MDSAAVHAATPWGYHVLGGGDAILAMHSHAGLLDIQCPSTGPAQDSGLQRYYGDIVSTIERDMDEPPDWRKTAFWGQSSFMQAWQMWKLLPPSGRMETEPERERLRCALFPASSWLHLHMLVHGGPQIPCRRSSMAMLFGTSPNQRCWLPGREAAAQANQAALLAPENKAAAEQLEARALLLAGQAGLCCNPRRAMLID